MYGFPVVGKMHLPLRASMRSQVLHLSVQFKKLSGQGKTYFIDDLGTDVAFESELDDMRDGHFG
jgi:hypothetical protein